LVVSAAWVVLKEMTKNGRLLAILQLFSIDQPVLAAEEVASRLGLSISTAYRYISELCEAGLLDRAVGSISSGFVLGPAILEFDRQVRLADPLLRLAKPVMEQLLVDIGGGAAILLSRLYRDRVMCVQDVVDGILTDRASYQRGLPMPLFRGATSLAILANLPPRTVRRLLTKYEDEVDPDYAVTRERLAAIRRAGICIEQGGLDTRFDAFAVPIFDSADVVVASLSAILHSETAERTPSSPIALALRAAAAQISLHTKNDLRGAQ
jgi:DNA-binding IclR family transcriptional regulator